MIEGKFMDNEQDVTLLRGESDVIMMRAKVRDLAREIGMDMMQQASVSLAASSLAHALGFRGMQEGQVMIEHLYREGRDGLRVIFLKPNGVPSELSSVQLSDAKWMVDELKIDALPSRQLQVTLIKWLN
jgi:hypothetical protein